MTPDKLKELRKIAEKATPVVMGYPFDMDFAKEAMNSFIPLLDQLAEANEHIKELERLHHANLCRWEEKDREFVVAREKQLNEKLEKAREALYGILSNVSCDWYIARYRQDESENVVKAQSGMVARIHNAGVEERIKIAFERAETCLKEISDEGAG